MRPEFPAVPAGYGLPSGSETLYVLKKFLSSSYTSENTLVKHLT